MNLLSQITKKVETQVAGINNGGEKRNRVVVDAKAAREIRKEQRKKIKRTEAAFARPAELSLSKLLIGRLELRALLSWVWFRMNCDCASCPTIFLNKSYVIITM